MMATKKRTSEEKADKPNKIVSGIACNCFIQFFIFIRTWLDILINFVFSLYWDGMRQNIPDLEVRHKILAESATTLAKKIRNKEIKSEELVNMVIERIKAVNSTLNAMTDERFELALSEAKQVDEIIAKGVDDEYFEKKPFLGVPFTCKESHAMQGCLHTLGVVCRRDVRAHYNAECVRLLIEAGAIPLAVTNVPEINKWQETFNNVFGLTVNPYHTGRTVGGSSGGEAALHAAFATPISLCSDIGGSTRMPAFYCGLFGHNPTAGTTSLKGSVLRSGLHDTMASIGFIARHSADLGPLTKVVAAEKAPLLNLDRRIDFKDIKFYYVESATDLRLSPVSADLKKAMNNVISHLKHATGSAPRRFSHRALRHVFSLWKYHMSREAEDFAAMLCNNNGRANGLLELARKLLGSSQYTFAAILKLLDDQIMPLPKAEWAEPLTEQTKKDLQELLGTNGVLLFPSCSMPAPYHYTAYLRPFNFAYWGFSNALRFPATQIPLGLNTSGVPLGIQVVAAPYNDGLCLQVAEYLEDKFGRFVPPCRVP